jgi:transcriptional regulator with XRE-family HTH domain
MPRSPSKSAKSSKSAKPAKSSDAIELGQRLKYVRDLFGFSQRELGAKAGLTHGTISFIEAGKISPAVGTLRKILDSLPITLAEFFAIDPSSEPRVFFGNDELVEVGGGGVSLKQVGRNLKGRPLQILYEHYPVGAETASEPYSHDGEEGGVVVKGHIEITVGNQTRRLGAGEAFLFPSRLPHRFRNPGPGECVIVSVNSPPA